MDHSLSTGCLSENVEELLGIMDKEYHLDDLVAIEYNREGFKLKVQL